MNSGNMFTTSSAKAAFNSFSHVPGCGRNRGVLWSRSGVGTAGDYVKTRAAVAAYCTPNLCHPNPNFGSQGVYRGVITANRARDITEGFDKTELYVNLVTELDLSGDGVVSAAQVLQNQETGACPTEIVAGSVPYTTYYVDPLGELFGNTPCGLQNYVQFMRYNVK